MIYASRWLLPIDRRPIEGAWFEIDGGTIVRMGQGDPPAAFTDLGEVAVLPGLVNAHTHLELSWLEGRIPPADSFVDWVSTLLDLRGRGHAPPIAEQIALVRRALETVRATGTVLVGDVTNSLVTPALMAEAGVSGVVFHELLGFNVIDPGPIVSDARAALGRALFETRTRARGEAVLTGRLAAHASYSVAPDLIRQIARTEAFGGAPLTVHLSESVEELELLARGTGPMRRLLEALGVWTEQWTPPGVGPAAYLDRLGYLRPGVLAVHGVHLDEAEIDLLVRRKAVLVVCPRSNVWVGAGLPRIAHLIAAGLRMAIGTDSLASTSSLNVFDELAELRRIAPDVAAASLLESATRIGAEALGFGDRYGTIAPGKAAALIAVDLPAGVRDVEEYLVGSIPPSAVRPVT